MKLFLVRHGETENSNYNPTENSTTSVRVDFNVTDFDGIGDLNNAACKCEFDNSMTWQSLYETASDTACDNTTINENTTQYTCLVNMQFWYQATNYSINITIADTSATVTNASKTFVYNQLVASSIDLATIDFGTLAISDFGTNKTDINSPTLLTNTGNVNLSLNITGAALTTGSSSINANQFYADIDSTIDAALQLIAGSQQITGALVPAEDSMPGGNTEEIWWFFAVPERVGGGSYSGTWVLEETST